MAESPELLGGPVWGGGAWAMDAGCRMIGESNADIGKLLPLWAGREGSVHGETVRLWRIGRSPAPFWAYVGLWRRLRSQGHTVAALWNLLGFSFRE
jgi:hypothetical protein